MNNMKTFIVMYRHEMKRSFVLVDAISKSMASCIIMESMPHVSVDDACEYMKFLDGRALKS